MNLNEIRTRREVIRALAVSGVTGIAAEAIAKETASVRHAFRVNEAKAVALSEAERLFGDWLRKESAQLVETTDDTSSWGESFVQSQLRALAAFLCLLETAGIGGRDGVEGAATARLSCFSSLGKGRKQARDGGAWSAAIAQAGEQLLPGAKLYCPNGTVCLGISNNSAGYEEETSITVSPAQLHATGLAPWAMTVAREGLRLALGLQPWLGWKLRFQIDRDDEDSAKFWALLVNELASTTTCAVEAK